MEQRRRQLLDLGARLFARHAYDEVSMAQVAREAGISKPLLYHYFRRKQDFFVATLAQQAERVRALTEPPPDAPPAEALAASLDAFLGWVEQNELAYRKLLESAGSVPEVRGLVEEVRRSTAARILAGLGVADPPPPRLRAAAHAWLWFLDGAIADHLAHRDLKRAELRDFLLGALGGALEAAGGAALLSPASPRPSTGRGRGSSPSRRARR